MVDLNNQSREIISVGERIRTTRLVPPNEKVTHCISFELSKLKSQNNRTLIEHKIAQCNRIEKQVYPHPLAPQKQL